MKTNAKAKVSHHIKSAHHVVKKTHELFKKSKTCNYTNALLLILTLSIAILSVQMFFDNKNKTIPEAEIRFTELSKDKKILGTIMPASCQSDPDFGYPHYTSDSRGRCDSSCAVSEIKVTNYVAMKLCSKVTNYPGWCFGAGDMADCFPASSATEYYWTPSINTCPSGYSLDTSEIFGTQTFVESISCITPNWVNYCVPITGTPAHRGYLWQYNLTPLTYQPLTPAESCNPCPTDQTWNSLSGASATCTIPPAPVVNITFQ